MIWFEVYFIFKYIISMFYDFYALLVCKFIYIQNLLHYILLSFFSKSLSISFFNLEYSNKIEDLTFSEK